MMSIHDYSQFALGWLHPGGCEHYTSPSQQGRPCLELIRERRARLEARERETYPPETAQHLIGVFWNPKREIFTGRIRVHGETIYLCASTNPYILAARYNAAVIEYQLVERRLNEIPWEQSA